MGRHFGRCDRKLFSAIPTAHVDMLMVSGCFAALSFYLAMKFSHWNTCVKSPQCAIYLSIYLSIYLFIYLFILYTDIDMNICIFIYLFMCLFIYLFIIYRTPTELWLV